MVQKGGWHLNRDQLRAADPQFAALADMARANGCEIRVSHYRFHDGGELGKREPLPANEFVISAESFDAAREHAAWLSKGKRK